MNEPSPTARSRRRADKRRATGGKRFNDRKKRKFELGRPPANAKIGVKKVGEVRTRGGNKKFRALRLESELQRQAAATAGACYRSGAEACYGEARRRPAAANRRQQLPEASAVDGARAGVAECLDECPGEQLWQEADEP